MLAITSYLNHGRVERRQPNRVELVHVVFLVGVKARHHLAIWTELELGGVDGGPAHWQHPTHWWRRGGCPSPATRTRTNQPPTRKQSQSNISMEQSSGRS